uniref:Uncharacterized protein n=1 Tax=Erythrolobus australicus TaxID=1077150 RepID=A0A7S1TKV1_9RHOD
MDSDVPAGTVRSLSGKFENPGDYSEPEVSDGETVEPAQSGLVNSLSAKFQPPEESQSNLVAQPSAEGSSTGFVKSLSGKFEGSGDLVEPVEPVKLVEPAEPIGPYIARIEDEGEVAEPGLVSSLSNHFVDAEDSEPVVVPTHSVDEDTHPSTSFVKSLSSKFEDSAVNNANAGAIANMFENPEVFEKDFNEKEAELHDKETRELANVEESTNAKALASRWEAVDYDKDFEEKEAELHQKEHEEIMARGDSNPGVMALAKSFKAFEEDEGKKDTDVPDLAEIKRRRELSKTAKEQPSFKSQDAKSDAALGTRASSLDKAPEAVAVGVAVVAVDANNDDDDDDESVKDEAYPGATANAVVDSDVGLVEERSMAAAEPELSQSMAMDDAEAEADKFDGVLANEAIPQRYGESETSESSEESEKVEDVPSRSYTAEPVSRGMSSASGPVSAPQVPLDEVAEKARRSRADDVFALLDEDFAERGAKKSSPYVGEAPKLVSVMALQPVSVDPWGEGNIADAVFVSDNYAFITGNDGRVVLWDFTNLNIINQFQPYSGEEVSFLHLLEPKKAKSLCLMTLSKNTRELKTWNVTADNVELLSTVVVPQGAVTVKNPKLGREENDLMTNVALAPSTDFDRKASGRTSSAMNRNQSTQTSAGAGLQDDSDKFMPRESSVSFAPGTRGASRNSGRFMDEEVTEKEQVLLRPASVVERENSTGDGFATSNSFLRESSQREVPAGTEPTGLPVAARGADDDDDDTMNPVLRMARSFGGASDVVKRETSRRSSVPDVGADDFADGDTLNVADEVPLESDFVRQANRGSAKSGASSTGKSSRVVSFSGRDSQAPQTAAAEIATSDSEHDNFADSSRTGSVMALAKSFGAMFEDPNSGSVPSLAEVKSKNSIVAE